MSRPINEIIQEAKQMASQGIKELILIAQELTYYGIDIYKERTLSILLKKLCRVEGIECIMLILQVLLMKLLML